MDDLAVGSIIKDGKFKIIDRDGSWLWGYQLHLQEIDSGKEFWTRSLHRPNGLKSSIQFKIGDQVQLLSGSIGTIRGFEQSGYLIVHDGKKTGKFNHRFLKKLQQDEQEE